MKKHIPFSFTIPFIIACFSCSFLNAQTAQEKYEKETIYLSYYNYSYIKNGQKYWTGFFGKNLKKEMEVSPDAVIEFDRYQKKSKTSFWLSIGAGVLIGTALSIDNNENLQRGLVIGGAGLAIATIPFTIESNKSYHKAIWLRNRDVLR